MRITAESKQETRKRILEAARMLFAEKGFSGTTTRDIAKQASIATGTLFNYFPGKEQLALALIDVSLAAAHIEFDKSRREGESLEEALFSNVAIAMRYLRPHRGYLGDVIESTLSPFSRSTGADPSECLRIRHMETVLALIEKHTSPTTPRPTAVTMHLYWTLYLSVLAYWAKDESPNQEDSLVLLDQALRLFVGSLQTEPRAMETNHAP